MPGYGLMASPTLYPGQTVRAVVEVPADAGSVVARLLIMASDAGDDDRLQRVTGPATALPPGTHTELAWTVPDLGGQPVTLVGVAVEGESTGSVLLLERLGWSGEPHVVFTRPAGRGVMWQRAWVNAVDRVDHSDEPYRLIQNAGLGQLIQGTREWRDYRVTADVTPHLAESAGVAARVQGLERGYHLELVGCRTARLVKRWHGETELASIPLAWEYGSTSRSRPRRPRTHHPCLGRRPARGRRHRRRPPTPRRLDRADRPERALRDIIGDGGAVPLRTTRAAAVATSDLRPAAARSPKSLRSR